MKESNAKTPSTKETWKGLVRWFEGHLPELISTLNAGAPESLLRAVEDQLGLPLPSDYRDSLKCYDGQSTDTFLVGFVYGLRLLPIQQSVNDWLDWKALGSLTELDGEAKSIPDGHIRNRYFDSGWLPITNDGAGNHIAIDLAPDRQGQTGQVILFGRDDLKHYVVAPSFSTFLRLILDRLAEENFIINRRGDKSAISNVPVIEFTTRVPRVKHFHSAVVNNSFNPFVGQLGS